MIVYLLTLLITTVPLYYLETTKKEIKNKSRLIEYTLLLSFAILFLLGALRAETVGSDVLNYKKYFENGFPGHKMEPLYVLLSNTIAYVSGNFRVFLAIVQLLVLIPIYYVIKNNKYKAFSIFIYQTLYLYVNSFNILRQAIAMGIVMLAIYYLDKYELNIRNTVIYTILVVVASLFHAASLFFLIVPMIKYMQIDKYKILIFILLSILISFFRSDIINFVFSMFGRNYYTEFTYNFGMSTIVIFSILLTLVVIDLKQNRMVYQENNLLINLIIFFFLFNIFWAWFPNHARITQYIFLALIIWLPKFLNSGDLCYKNFNIRKITSVVFLITFYLLMLYAKDPGMVLPYRLLGM